MGYEALNVGSTEFVPQNSLKASASVAPGKLTAAASFARIDIVRRLGRIAHHAWRSATHLLGRGGTAIL